MAEIASVCTKGHADGRFLSPLIIFIVVVIYRFCVLYRFSLPCVHFNDFEQQIADVSKLDPMRFRRMQISSLAYGLKQRGHAKK